MPADIELLRIKDDYLRGVLEGTKFLVFDGGLGTMIQKAGLDGVVTPPDLLNLSHPEAIEDIARAYVEAGCDVVTTNTFGSNARELAGKASVEEVYTAAARIARNAGARYVAGDIGPTGLLLEPLGELSFEDAYELFAEQARAAADAGCDLIVVETMADLREAKAAVLAAVENTDLPVFATMTFGEGGRTFLGTTPAIAAATLSSMGVAAVGVNCSLGPDKLVEVVREVARYARCPVMAQPNAGLPRIVDGKTVYDVDPVGFAQSMEDIIAAGATIVGGCCGTSPEFIEELRAVVDHAEVKLRMWDPAFAVTSAQNMVELPEWQGCAVIGDLVNIACNEDLEEALIAGEYEDVASEAADQQDEEASIIGLCAAVPGVDEAAALCGVVEELQQMVPLPLRFESWDPNVLEAVARSYAGKPLIGPVDGRSETLFTVLPLARKYGCSVIGLTCDELGVPETAEERLLIARRIIEAAEQEGIPRCDVVIDCMAPGCVDSDVEVAEALRTIISCKMELGVRTTLGGSEQGADASLRALTDAEFLASALRVGVDLPLVNLCDEELCEVVEDYS